MTTSSGYEQSGIPSVHWPWGWRGIATIASLYGLLAFVCTRLSIDDTPVAAFWIGNAIVVGLLLDQRRKWKLAVIGACFVTDLVASAVLGEAAAFGVLRSVANSCEIVFACALLERFLLSGERVASLRHIWILAIVGVVAPTAPGAVFAFAVETSGGGHLFRSWALWLAGHCIAIPIFTAMTLIVRNQRAEILDTLRTLSWARSRTWAILAAGFISMVLVVFGQARFPFLFLAMPLVVFAGFRTGVLGTALTVAALTIASTVATFLDYGPITLVRGNIADQMITLQVFLAACLAVGLPVAVVLEEHARVQRELRKSRDFIRTVVDGVNEVIFTVDRDWRWTYLNRYWTVLSGETVDQALGKVALSYVIPEDRQQVATLRSAIEAGVIPGEQLVVRFQRGEGDLRHIVIHAEPQFDEDGAFCGAIGSLADITERENALRGLQQREEQLALLANNATDAVLCLALNGICTYASPSVRQVFGVGCEAMQGQQFITRFHPDDDAIVRATFDRLARGSQERARVAFRSRSLVAPQNYNWLEANCGLVRDPETGAPMEVIVSLRNVNETKQLEAELTAARAAAEDAAAAKTAFLANISHEIRTPMNGVIGFTELALQGDLSEDQRKHLEMIADSGRAMMRLLNDVLDLAKIESGQMAINCEPVDIRHKIDRCLRLMEPVARQKGLALSMNVAEEFPRWIESDPMRLRQIILNLVGNALKFTERGEVTVTVSSAISPTGPRMQLDVRDTGIGIAPDRIASVFENFTQADSSTARRYGGTGLGLPISAQLAELLGGTLTASSEPGVGTTFTLSIPAVAVAAPIAPATGTRLPLRPEGVLPLRVLVAEDNPINQQLTLAMLQQIGIEADLAQDGAETIEMVERNAMSGEPYDIVLMDMQMPAVDGIEATRRLRASGYDARRLPIVALTANAYADDIANSIDAGMQAHLSKPLRLRELRMALEQWGRPQEGAAIADPQKQVPVEADPALVQMFAERKVSAVIAIDEAIRQGSLEGKTLADLAAQLHQIAGVAAYFGQAELGEASSDAEGQLLKGDQTQVPAVLDGIRRLLAA